MKVESLIERVRQSYASARLYADRGEAIVNLGDDHVTISFETSFERPDRFSFSFTAEPSVSGRELPERYAYRIESDGRLVTVVGEPKLHDGTSISLEMAIAGLTGISFGCAHAIPSLLMPDRIGGRGLFDWPRRTLGDPVDIDGASHLMIELGAAAADHLTRVFVNEATLVVRRTDTPGGRTVTDYAAVLNF